MIAPGTGLCTVYSHQYVFSYSLSDYITYQSCLSICHAGHEETFKYDACVINQKKYDAYDIYQNKYDAYYIYQKKYDAYDIHQNVQPFLARKPATAKKMKSE